MATNVYHILADEADEPMEVYEPTGMAFSWGTDKWNRARVKQINKEQSLRNEKRRIAREEQDKRISARIERKKEKQELRRAAMITNENTAPIYFASEHRSSTKSRRLEEEARQRAKREQQLKLAAKMKQKYQPPNKHQARKPYEQLPQLRTPRMFSQQALSAFNAEALGINIKTPQAATEFIGRQL